MKRLVFIFSEADDAAAIIRAKVAELSEQFDIVAFDNATTTNAAGFLKENLYAFGAVHTLVKRSETPLPFDEAQRQAMAFARRHFDASEIELAVAGCLPGGEKENCNVPEWSNPASESIERVATSIQSFATVATHNFFPELMLLIRSLRFRTRKPIYVAADDAVFRKLKALNVENVFPFRIATRERLDWLYKENFAAKRLKSWPRDEYPHCPPACLVKMDICRRALELSENTLYLDADFIAVGSIVDEIETDCAFTPSFHSPKWEGAAETFGTFNAGCVFTSSPAFVNWWYESALHESRFMDQQCLDNAAAAGFSVSQLSPAHNFGFWRIWHESRDLKNTKMAAPELAALLGFSQGKDGIELNGEPLVSFHVQMFHETPGHAPLQRLVRHLLSESRNPYQVALAAMLPK